MKFQKKKAGPAVNIWYNEQIALLLPQDLQNQQNYLSMHKTKSL